MITVDQSETKTFEEIPLHRENNDVQGSPNILLSNDLHSDNVSRAGRTGIKHNRREEIRRELKEREEYMRPMI